MKLSHKAFIELNDDLVQVYYETATLDKAYPTSIFADLYHQRWGVEEDYKVLKNRLNIKNFSSVSVEGVLQDMHAKLLTKNITACAIHNEASKVSAI
jgi:hypothetical protein